ncbi:MAG: Crp/Fnr family transcriptional regulator [Massiliimalia sp.]|jgi:CRP/FNR family cyclic AMP-dependent transcriptional regulator
MDYSNYFMNPHEKAHQKEWDIFEQKELPSLLYAKNQMVYWQGEEAVRFYYLKEGTVRIFLSSEDGAEKTISILKPGSVFGEASFFDGLPRVSSAKTLEKSKIIAIGQKELLTLFGEHPNLAMTMLGYLAKTVRMLSAQVDHMAFLQADQRLAQLLISLAENRKVFSTHEELASLVGVSRVTVSKLIGKFVKNGWIATGYGYLELLDEEQLKKFGFFQKEKSKYRL